MGRESLRACGERLGPGDHASHDCVPQRRWLGRLYDGAADISENYEERCGMARSADLRTWERFGSGPAIGSAGGSGTVRYVESVVFANRLRFFFERTRQDGAHELRMSPASVNPAARRAARWPARGSAQ